MDIILLESIRHLGKLGDKIKVKPGFGRNYLIPYGKAAPANASNIAKFEARRAELEKAAKDKLAKAAQRAAAFEKLTVTISHQASDQGKLYGSVATKEIAIAVSQAGESLEKREVLLPEGALRQVGEYDVALQLHSDVSATLKLVIVAQK